MRRGANDYPVDDVGTPIKPMIGNGFAGSPVFWSAHVPRFRPGDYRLRMLDGVGDNWPVANEDFAACCPLSEDAKTCVVDPFGRCHDVPNLYLADASVFVTSAAINPTATTQALALRTADHIVATRHA